MNFELFQVNEQIHLRVYATAWTRGTLLLEQVDGRNYFVGFSVMRSPE
jgi:hypothetical protein